VIKKLKVVHIEDRFHPLMGYQLNFFAKHHSSTIDFHIVTSDSLSIWQGDDNTINIAALDKEFESNYNITIHRLKSRNRDSQKSNLWVKGLYNYVIKLNPDVIFLHGIESYSSIKILLNLYLSIKKINVFADTHTLYNQFEKSLKFKLHLVFIRLIVKKLVVLNNVRVFATTNENKEILINNYRFPLQNIDSLPIGTDSDQFYFSDTARQQLRQNLNIEPTDLVLLYIGKFNEKKKPHLILEAIKKIEDKITCTLYILFVGPKIEPYFSEHFYSNNLTNKNQIKIKFIDSVDNSLLYEYYSMADFAVFPKENTLSALDSQACRLPVIMEDNLTNNSRLEKGGLAYKENDIRDLGEKIFTLIIDKDLRSKLSLEGQKFILENYEYKNIIKKFENLILV